MTETEDVNPASRGLDRMSIAEVIALMCDEDAKAISAVRSASAELEKITTHAVDAIRAGGRVVYAGAGTSGRLGVLDASEAGPTFGAAASFRAVIAGGARAVTEPVEGAEDDHGAGGRVADEMGLGANDLAIGITASGSTPYVLGFLKAASQRGAAAWMVKCTDAETPDYVHGAVTLLTGPEVIAGSTRLKAGTATKAALNIISTGTMIRLGGTYDGLMVDVVPNNAKLRERAIRIIREITGCGRNSAEEALPASGMRPKTACLMIMRNMDRQAAQGALERAGGSLRAALEGRV